VAASLARRPARAGRLVCARIVSNQRHQLGGERLQELYRKRARKLVLGRVRLVDVRGDGAEKTIADEKHERCRAVHYPRLGEAAAPAVDFVTMVSRSGLAADRKRFAGDLREAAT